MPRAEIRNCDIPCSRGQAMDANERGSTHVGNITDSTGVAIGDHAQAFITMINLVTRRPVELPTRYEARVRNFLEYYYFLPRTKLPTPFGGRAADLAALDEWLADENAPPYATLIAPRRARQVRIACPLVGASGAGTRSPHHLFPY
jgi:hypothetical protein